MLTEVTSFEMLELNHTSVSKTIIIIIMLNIEAVENAMPERKGYGICQEMFSSI